MKGFKSDVLRESAQLSFSNYQLSQELQLESEKRLCEQERPLRVTFISNATLTHIPHEYKCRLDNRNLPQHCVLEPIFA
jgi:hypothetical protein